MTRSASFAARALGVLLGLAPEFEVLRAQQVEAPSAQAQTQARAQATKDHGYHFEAGVDPVRSARAAQRAASDAASHGDVRFVLLKHALELASGAGELKLALEVLAALEAEYRVDVGELGLSAVREALQNSSGAERRLDTAQRALAWADGAARRGDFERTLQVLDTLGLRSIANQFESIREACAELRLRPSIAAYERVRSDIELLESKPDDAGACYRVGAYRAFDCGDLETGLPLLRRGSEAAYATLAERELRARSGLREGESEPLALADAWLELARSCKFESRARAMRQRALHWLREARGQSKHLQPDESEQLQARIQALQSSLDTTPAPDETARAAAPASVRRVALDANFEFDSRIRPGAQFALEFPELCVDRRGQVAAALVRIPERFDPALEFPMAVWLAGGEGNKVPSEAGKLVDPTRFVLVGLPYPESSRGTPGSVYLSNFEVVRVYHAQMLAQIASLIPNLSRDARLLGGFSNGGHCIWGVLSNSGEAFLRDFRAFVFADGGDGRGPAPNLAGACAFVCWGELSPNRNSSMALQRALERQGARVVAYEQSRAGHTFTDDARAGAKGWFAQEALPQLFEPEFAQLETAAAGAPGAVLLRLRELALVAEASPLENHIQRMRERIEADGRQRLSELREALSRAQSESARSAARVEAGRLAGLFAGADVARELEAFAAGSKPKREPAGGAGGRSPRRDVVEAKAPRAAHGAAVDVLVWEGDRLWLHCPAQGEVWGEPRLVAKGCSAPGAAVVGQSGAVEVLARKGRLLHHLRAGDDGEFEELETVSARASGAPAAAVGRDGALEVVCFEDRGLMHFSLDREGKWRRNGLVGADARGVVSLIRGYHGNLEMVIRESDNVQHLWAPPGGTWRRAHVISSNCDGAPSMVLGPHKNLEVVVREGAELMHYWARLGQGWNRAGPVTRAATGDASLTVGASGALELVVQEAEGWVHYRVTPSAGWTRGALVAGPAARGAQVLACSHGAR